MQKFNNFADLANARMELADTRSHVTAAYDGAFLEQSDMAKLSVVDEPMATEMPDPDMARRAVEMAIGTVFDVLKDTRMEEFAQQLAWGMVNSFHMTARLVEGREDDAALGDGGARCGVDGAQPIHVPGEVDDDAGADGVAVISFITRTADPLRNALAFGKACGCRPRDMILNG